MEFLRLKFSPFLFLCSTGLFAIFSSTIAKSPVLPLFATHLGAGPSGVGLVASISAFARVIFSVPAGIINAGQKVRSFGRRKSPQARPVRIPQFSIQIIFSLNFVLFSFVF